MLSNESEPQPLKGLDDPALGSIDRKLGHQVVTSASATNASNTGDSTSNTPLPNVLT